MKMLIHVNLIISPTQLFVGKAMQIHICAQFTNALQHRLSEMYAVHAVQQGTNTMSLAKKAARGVQHHQGGRKFLFLFQT